MGRNYTQAHILPEQQCKECGYPVVSVLCNSPFTGYRDSSFYDLWAYCSNKQCGNHEGEGYDMNPPNWVEDV